MLDELTPTFPELDKLEFVTGGLFIAFEGGSNFEIDDGVVSDGGSLLVEDPRVCVADVLVPNPPPGPPTFLAAVTDPLKSLYNDIINATSRSGFYSR